jgi:DNA primase
VAVDWSDAKERVRQAIDIVELIGGDRQLRREGRGYKALCPWHDDSRPSLTINTERQSFKCWVCDIGGDVFTWVMRREGVEFPEALRMLADRAGIQLEAPRASQGGGLTGDEKRDLLQALAWAEQRFHAFLLNAPDAEPARRYLADRGITADSIHRFKLGYSPNRWDWLLGEARQTAFNQKLLAAAGLAVEKQNGPGVYDRFRGRVLFSIRDVQSRIVGFGGRVLPGISDDNPAKYVNSPETPLFSKSNLLYALDQAKDAIAKSGTAVVMEGYTDVIIAHQCGFHSAVAVLGTALGERHIRLLRRFAERIVLVLDGDEAGRRRTDDILSLFVAEQVDLRVLTLPDELDPADYLLQLGKDAFAGLLGKAIDALDHKYRTVVAELGANPSTHQVIQAVEGVLAVLAGAPRSVTTVDSAAKLREDQMLVRLAQLSGVAEDRLRKRLADLRRATTQNRLSREDDPPGRTEPTAPATAAFDKEPKFLRDAEQFVMEILVAAPQLLVEVRESLVCDDLRHPTHRTIYAKACELSEAGTLPDFDRLMLEFDAPQVKNSLIDLDEGRRRKGREATAEELHELATVLRDRRSGVSTTTLTGMKSATTDNSEGDVSALRRSIERQRRRHGISLPTDG